MEQILINLVTGALGGVAVGKSSPTFDLGMTGNIISGLVGGGLLGQIVTPPAMACETTPLTLRLPDPAAATIDGSNSGGRGRSMPR